MTYRDSSWLYGSNTGFIEQIYETFLTDPERVDPAWRQYFESLNDPSGGVRDVAHGPIRERFRSLTEAGGARPAATGASDGSARQVAVLQLINAYRFRGHRRALLDPLNQSERPEVAELDPSYHGLTAADMETVFNTGSLHGPSSAPLGEIIDTVTETYCGTIGAEYMHMVETAEKRWIQQRLESVRSKPRFDADKKRHILGQVIAASALEEYLHTKYVGQKRFSLEGGESAIPLMDQIIESAGTAGIKEVVIGMAHRGRLNVLVNIVGKHPSKLFQEFEGLGRGDVRSGDVKYHLGYSSDIRTPGG